jgi:uncharacterized membrane protein YhaH (DUF805 family)
MITSFQRWFIDVLRYKYAGFKGRATRQEFWMFMLWSNLVTIAGAVVGSIAFGTSITEQDPLSALLCLALLIPWIAITTRRLHDIGRTGWWQLLALTIIGIVVLLIFNIQDSVGDNKYGPHPKKVPDPAPAV